MRAISLFRLMVLKLINSAVALFWTGTSFPQLSTVSGRRFCD